MEGEVWKSMFQTQGPVPARYVRHSKMCPQLDVSEKMTKKRKKCPTKLYLSDKNDKKPQDISDKKR